MSPTDYALLIDEIARRFDVRLNIVPGMSPEDAGSGFVVLVCNACTRKNVLRRPGTIRCGACKADLGRHSRYLAITVAPIIDETTFAVAMHELGHALHPTGRVTDSQGSMSMRKLGKIATLRDMRLMLLEETSAWEWAEANTPGWTPPMQSVKDWALSTYYAHARRLGLRPDGQRVRY